jgi:signal peptidase I
MENKNIMQEIKSWIFSILLAFCIAVLINSKVSAKVLVQQSSMENTLYNNQQLIVDKLSYNFVEPKRGDIIVFLENEEKGTIVDDALNAIDNIASIFNNSGGSDQNNRLVKRVIGVSGDEVDIIDGYVYLNGKKLEEPYAKGETISGKFKLPIKIGENKLFVLGDNRMVSKDSREFGLINSNQVEGKAIYRIYPFNQIGKIK